MKYFICAFMMMPTVVFALSLRQPVPDPVVIVYPDGSTYTLEDGEYAYVSDDKVFRKLEKEVNDKLSILLEQMGPNEKRDYQWEITPLPVDPCINFPEQYECWDEDDDEEEVEIYPVGG